MRYVPAWLPGASWKRLALDLKKQYLRIVHEPYDKVKDDVVSPIESLDFILYINCDKLGSWHCSEINCGRDGRRLAWR